MIGTDLRGANLVKADLSETIASRTLFDAAKMHKRAHRFRRRSKAFVER